MVSKEQRDAMRAHLARQPHDDGADYAGQVLTLLDALDEMERVIEECARREVAKPTAGMTEAQAARSLGYCEAIRDIKLGLAKP